MILHGDSLHELKTVADDSIDFVCTDPPYGYSFMGKDWDKAVPSVAIWQQCLRVLKPGAFMCVMSAPRSDVQNAMISRLMEAGFRLGFTPIYWTYASGFPKAGNIGKLVDKRNGRTPDWYVDFAKHYSIQRKAKGLTHNQVCEAAGAYANHNHGGASTNWEKGYNVPTLEQWKVLQPLLDLSLEYLPMIEREEAEREIVGQRKLPAQPGFASTTYGAKGGLYVQHNDTISATDQAKALDGSYAGFQPKPAVEVIIVAMKPLAEKTYVDQALANGHGVSWLDDGRIPTDTPIDSRIGHSGFPVSDADASRPLVTSSQGRFPANLLVSDDVLNDGVERKSGSRKGQYSSEGNVYGKYGDKTKELIGDSGSYSRFFDLDKWYERNEYEQEITSVPENQKDKRYQRLADRNIEEERTALTTLPFLITPKASKSEKNKGLEDITCTHPTVKPLRLMSYLITLFSRPGDIVLDPFCGSGSTNVAAHNLGRETIGIEREAEYVEIARARLAHVKPEIAQLPEEKPEAAVPPVTLEAITESSQLSLL
jgi:DNA modification methylase